METTIMEKKMETTIDMSCLLGVHVWQLAPPCLTVSRGSMHTSVFSRSLCGFPCLFGKQEGA